MTDAEFVEAAKQLVTMEVVTDLRQRLADAEARVRELEVDWYMESSRLADAEARLIWWRDRWTSEQARVRELEEALHGLLSKNTRMRPVAEFENPDEWIVVTKSAFDFANAALARRTP